MSGLTSLWPVLVKDATEALVIEGSEPVPEGWTPVPVYAANEAGVAKALAIRVGSGSFVGNGGSFIELGGIAHGLPTGFSPYHVEAVPALSSDGVWFAMGSNYQLPSATEFYWAFALAPFVSGAGTFEVSGGGEQIIDGNFLIGGGGSSGSGAVSGSSVITGALIAGNAAFTEGETYYFTWVVYGLAT